jgi:hypothetical protein
MPTRTKPRPSRKSVIRTPTVVPTLSQLVRAGQESAAKIKRATKVALAEWFAQSERLNIARTHYKLRGERFADFANRIGVDRASAYQLVKLWRHRTAILARCRDEARYYGWETCLYWFERDPRRSWHRSPHGSHTDEYGTPPSVFKRFGSNCTLDVCATPTTAVCPNHFTKAQDGLKRPWHGIVLDEPTLQQFGPMVRQSVRVCTGGWYRHRAFADLDRCAMVP